jgi:PAS domain S-box-containing protein
MLNTQVDKEIPLDCNEQKAKDISTQYLSLIHNHDIDGAIDFLAPQFTWIGPSIYTDKKVVRDILVLEMSNSRKYIFHNAKIKVQKLCDSLYLILLPITIQRKSASSNNIVASVIVDIKIEKIISITLPIENKEPICDDYTVGTIHFCLDDKLTIKKIDDEVSHFLSFFDAKEFTEYFDNGLINAIKCEDKKGFIKLLHNNKSNYSKFVSYVSVMNKMGEFIEIIFEICIIQITDSTFEISAAIHDSMSLDDLKMLNGQRFSRLTNILNNSPSPFFYKNIDGEYLGFNKAYLKNLGIKDSYNLVGKTDYDFLSKETSDLHMLEDLEVINKKKNITRYTKVERDGGITNHYQYTKSPLIEKGKVVGILCFLVDVSDVKNLNNELIKSQSELNYIFNNSHIAYFLKDTNLRFKRVNETYLKTNNYKLWDVIGKTNEELFGSSIGVFNFSTLERKILKTKKPFSLSQFMTGENGKKFYFSIIESPLFDDNHNVTGIVGSIEDITLSVERQIKLEARYKSTMKFVSAENFLAFVRMDLDDFKIVEFQSVNDIGFKESVELNDNILQFFIRKMVYENEKIEAKKIFNYESLKFSFSPEGRFNCEYTFAPNSTRLNVANIEVTYNINPSNNHREVFLYAMDVTKRYQLNELVKSITKTGYDFIVKISVQINRCEFIVFDKKIYKFEKNQNTFNITEFLDILFKDTENKIPERDFSASFVKKELANNDEFKYSFDTTNGRRKSLVVRSLNKERETYLLTLIDITDITLKDKILQERLQKSVIDSEKASNIKTDFLARMSHDMRTPLNGIMGLADFGVEEDLNDDMRAYFSKIKISSRYLLTLLNDVLDMQSIEKGKIRIFPKVMIAEEFIREVETIVIPSVNAKDIALKVILPSTGPKYLFDDSVRICQVLVNILNNAIKYTGVKGHITYSTEYIGGLKHIYKVTISDDGVGMSDEFQQHMFESFTTETNKYSSIEGGTGLGLAISNNLVSLMGGHIECYSTLDVGTTFTIFIPTHPITEQKYLTKTVSNDLINLDELKGKRILICEDNKINIMILEKLLQGKGLVVDTAENGEIGIQKAKNNKYDAIFMDIRMPIMDGLTAASLIRKTDKKIPIIALSANAYKEDVDKSIEAGMNAHLSKPIDKNELFTTLRLYLK